MEGTKILETKRMTARKIVSEDVDNLQKIFSDSLVMQFFPNTKNKKETME